MPRSEDQMTRPRDWSEMRAMSVDLLERRTGAGVHEWNERVRISGADDSEPQLRTWLTERGVTGYAQQLLVMERFGYPDFLTASADQLIDGQYADRLQLRPILDHVLAVAGALGEVMVQARKGYVSLVSPRRTFAVVRPTTKQRVDLGLRLDGRIPEGRLQSGTGVGSDSINVRVALHSVEDVDDEVVGLLEAAYSANV
jgi:hypothetical protein